jgi:hypothetical protein
MADQEIPVNTKTCSICLFTFSDEMPHADCWEMHGKFPERPNDIVCQPCFFDWIYGKQRDNIGFKPISCDCGKKFTHQQVKNILDPDQFIQYDTAITKCALENMKTIVYCPGVDCPNAYVKPKRKHRKRQCRKAVCDECHTPFCCLCGSLYTTEHQRMKCAPFKKWKESNDDDTIALNAWRKSRIEQNFVQPCPSCKHDIEKNSGCRSMTCTNCLVSFCWICSTPFRGASCNCVF